MPANFVGHSGAPQESGRRNDTEDPNRARRRTLLWLAAALFLISIGVQIIGGFTDTWMQLAPLALASLGVAAIGNCLFDDDKNARWLVRITSALVAIGGAYGTYEHLTSDDAGLPPLFTTVLLTITAAITAFGTCARTPAATDDEPAAPNS